MTDSRTDEERDAEAERAYEQHYKPADSDPDSQPLPGPRPVQVRIACCPRCGNDLTDEAFEFWCPACQQAVSFREAAIFDETDYERD